MTLPEVKAKAKRFEYDHDESFVAYRLRLRALCELYALAGRPRTAREMFLLWKKGLRYTIWEEVVNEVRFDAVKGRRFTDVEVIYALERIRVYTHGEPMLQEMTFVLKWEERSRTVDFRTWNGLGPLYVYAHDQLLDHSDWSEADSRDHFYWMAVYNKLLTTPRECHPNEPYEAGVDLHPPLDQEMARMGLLATSMDEIPGETIGMIVEDDEGDEDEDEEVEEEEAEPEEELPRDEHGNYRIGNYLLNPHAPASGRPWISEEFQPYGSNLPQEENPSHENSPMPPSLPQESQQPNQEESPAREIRTVEEVERERTPTEQRFPTPTPDQSTPTRQGRSQAPESSWRAPITYEWEGDLQRRWRQYCEEEENQHQEEEEEEEEEDPSEEDPNESEARLQSHELIHIETEDDEPATNQFLNDSPEYSGGWVEHSPTPSPIRSITAKIPDRHLHHFTSEEVENEIQRSVQQFGNPTPREQEAQNRKRRMTVKQYLKSLMGRKRPRGSSSRNPGDAPSP